VATLPKRSLSHLVEKLARNAYTVESSSPGELAKFLKADTEKWEAVIRTTGIKID
jgi:hypothetical protein